MMISALTGEQAKDMGIVEAAVRQAELAEVEQAHAEALKLNREVVYVEGHGTRAYELTEYYTGSDLFSVRPLSGGMEWSYDRRGFGTVPFVPCQCEHVLHETAVSCSCMTLTPQGVHTVPFSGTVCGPCKEEHHN